MIYISCIFIKVLVLGIINLVDHHYRILGERKRELSFQVFIIEKDGETYLASENNNIAIMSSMDDTSPSPYWGF